MRTALQVTTKRIQFLVLIAAGLVSNTADSVAAQKKTQSRNVVAAFKECCDRANATMFQWNGQVTCRVMQSRFQDAFNQCIYEKGIRLGASSQMSR